VQTTPLIQSPKIPSFYYLSLKGITVGSTRLQVPESAFALTNNGTGGTIIDSGTSFTTLPLQVYRRLRAAFVSQVKLPPAEASNATTDADPICFVLPSSGDRPGPVLAGVEQCPRTGPSDPWGPPRNLKAALVWLSGTLPV